MRVLRLLGAAAQAEGLLLRRQGAMFGRSMVFRIVAGIFGVVTLALLHVAAWIWLKQEFGSLRAALYLAGADAVLAGIMLWMAKPGHDPVAEEALRLREQSLAQLTARQPLSWDRVAVRLGSAIAMNLLRR